MSGCRSVAGRLFHSFGPATEKFLSPRRVLVRGTVRALASAERRRRRPESAMSWQSSARYDGLLWLLRERRDGVWNVAVMVRVIVRRWSCWRHCSPSSSIVWRSSPRCTASPTRRPRPTPDSSSPSPLHSSTSSSSSSSARSPSFITPCVCLSGCLLHAYLRNRKSE